MSKVTAKLQLTLPKALAERFHIRPGDDISWRATDDAIHLIPSLSEQRALDRDERLALFDQATARQSARQAGRDTTAPADRGWSREALYESPPARPR